MSFRQRNPARLSIPPARTGDGLATFAKPDSNAKNSEPLKHGPASGSQALAETSGQSLAPQRAIYSEAVEYGACLDTSASGFWPLNTPDGAQNERMNTQTDTAIRMTLAPSPGMSVGVLSYDYFPVTLQTFGPAEPNPQHHTAYGNAYDNLFASKAPYVTTSLEPTSLPRGINAGREQLQQSRQLRQVRQVRHRERGAAMNRKTQGRHKGKAAPVQNRHTQRSSNTSTIGSVRDVTDDCELMAEKAVVGVQVGNGETMELFTAIDPGSEFSFIFRHTMTNLSVEVRKIPPAKLEVHLTPFGSSQPTMYAIVPIVTVNKRPIATILNVKILECGSGLSHMVIGRKAAKRLQLEPKSTSQEDGIPAPAPKPSHPSSGTSEAHMYMPPDASVYVGNTAPLMCYQEKVADPRAYGHPIWNNHASFVSANTLSQPTLQTNFPFESRATALTETEDYMANFVTSADCSLPIDESRHPTETDAVEDGSDGDSTLTQTLFLAGLY